MTTTLPRAFAPVDGGWPTYFVTADGCDLPFAWPEPTLPAVAGAHWSDPAEITAAHSDLTAGALAELLYLVDFDPARFTADVVATAAVTAFDRALTTCGCDLLRCAAEVGAELADHPELCARFSRCFAFAAFLLEVADAD